MISLIGLFGVNADEGNIVLPAIGPNPSSWFDYAMYYANRPALYRRPTYTLRAYDRYGLQPRPYRGSFGGGFFNLGGGKRGLRRKSLFNKKDQFFKWRYNQAYRKRHGIVIDNDRDYFPYDISGNAAYTNTRKQPYYTNYY